VLAAVIILLIVALAAISAMISFASAERRAISERTDALAKLSAAQRRIAEQQTQISELTLQRSVPPNGRDTRPAPPPWPNRMADQITAVRDLVQHGGSFTAAQVAASFRDASETAIEPVLDSLVSLGHLEAHENGGRRHWEAIARGP
jgi:hypothetical protein